METPGHGAGAVELSAAECRDLLETDVVGRVAFVTPAGPRIVPVNYAVEGDLVRFRTSARTELAIYAPDHRVAFEIDHLDQERRRGWSVVVHGTVRRSAEDGEVPVQRPGQEPEPWAGGHRPLWLEVPLDEVSGRRVGGDHWPHPVVSGRGRSH